MNVLKDDKTRIVASRWFHLRFGSRVRMLGMLSVVTALGGCVVGPDYQQPSLTAPARWSAGKDLGLPKPPELSHWWTMLNDPVLNALVEEAVAGNLNVATATAKIREARASYRQSVGALFPTITNSEAVTRAKTVSASTSTAASSGDIGTTYQGGFDASWEADLFGANRRAVESATYGVDASQENLRSTLLTMVGDVTSYYVQARGYQARIALARHTAASQEETARITETKFDAGSVSAVDLANATGQAASTRATIPSLEISYSEMVHNLSVLTGRPPAALIDRLAKVRPVPVPKLPMPVGIPADILLSRPDVRLAERLYAQSTAQIGQAEAARYPSVSLTGNLKTSGTQIGDLSKNSTIGWSLGPAVTIPIFNAGKLKAAVEISQAQRDQYFIAYQASVLTALKDVENALVALSQERRRIGLLTVSATSYRQAASLSQTLYKSGTSSFLDVLTAERSLYSAEDALIQSRILVTVDYIALNKALGGGWDGLIDASKPAIIDTNTGPHLTSSMVRPVRRAREE